jgi:hypothetical protein
MPRVSLCPDPTLRTWAACASDSACVAQGQAHFDQGPRLAFAFNHAGHLRASWPSGLMYSANAPWLERRNCVATERLPVPYRSAQSRNMPTGMRLFLMLLVFGCVTSPAHANSRCIDLKVGEISPITIETKQLQPCYRLVFATSPKLLAYVVQLTPSLGAGIEVLDESLVVTSSAEPDANGVVTKVLNNSENESESIFRLNLKGRIHKAEKASVTAVELEGRAVIYIGLEQ